MGALMKNKGGVADQLRHIYTQPVLVPSLKNGTAKLPAPGITGRTTGRLAEFRCDSNGAANVRFLFVQERRDDGTWHARIESAKSSQFTSSTAPAAIAVRAVDKFGNLGEPTVLSLPSQ
jgi:hypothetical protein